MSMNPIFAAYLRYDEGTREASLRILFKDSKHEFTIHTKDFVKADVGNIGVHLRTSHLRPKEAAVVPLARAMFFATGGKVIADFGTVSPEWQEVNFKAKGNK